MTTQKVAILKYLRKYPKRGMTNGQGMRDLFINCPHKRVSELEKEGIRINRDKVPDPYHKGGKLTRYTLADPKQPEIKEYLLRYGA